MGIREVDDNIRFLVNKYGFAVMAVGSGEDSPPFAYTIGLYDTTGHPEICMSGFDPMLMQKLLQSAGLKVVEGEATFKDGELSNAIIQNFPVITRFLPTNQDTEKNVFTRACVFYSSRPFPMVQMFLPDHNGKFPDDASCDEKIAKVQTWLPGITSVNNTHNTQSKLH